MRSVSVSSKDAPTLHKPAPHLLSGRCFAEFTASASAVRRRAAASACPCSRDSITTELGPVSGVPALKCGSCPPASVPASPWPFRGFIQDIDCFKSCTIERLIGEAQLMTNDELSRVAKRGAVGTDHMPVEIKIMALKVLSATDLTFVRDHQLGQLKQMLDNKPPAGVEVTARYLPGNPQTIV